VIERAALVCVVVALAGCANAPLVPPAPDASAAGAQGGGGGGDAGASAGSSGAASGDAGSGGAGAGGAGAGGAGSGGAGAGGAGAGGDTGATGSAGASGGAGGAPPVDVSALKAECASKVQAANAAPPYTADEFCALYMNICGGQSFAGALTAESCVATYDSWAGKGVMSNPTAKVQSCVSYHICNANFGSAAVHCQHAAAVRVCTPSS
jgi:hypothetical protein